MPVHRRPHADRRSHSDDGATTGGLLAVLALLLAAATAVAATVLWPAQELPGIVRDPRPTVHGLAFEDHWAEGPDAWEGADEGTDGDADGDPGQAPTTDLVPPAGHVTLAYFGYLSCPDMCPLTMGDLRRARQLIGDDAAARTQVAFVTLDPDRDGPEELRAYLGLFFDQGVLALTAPDDSGLDEAADHLGVRYEVEQPTDPDGSYEIAHSAITYVIDDTGAVVRELAFGTTPEEYAEVIEHTLDAAGS